MIPSKKFLILLSLSFCLSFSFAQDVKFFYASKLGASNVDTILVYGRSNTNLSQAIGGVNLSWVFNSSCLSYTPGSFWSLFQERWGTLLQNDQLQNITVSYNGNNYDRRVQYGNALFFAAPIVFPDSNQAPLLVMKIWFTGACTSQIYMENEGENGLNQVADGSFTLLTYTIADLLANPLASIWDAVGVAEGARGQTLIQWKPTEEMHDGQFFVERSRDPNFQFAYRVDQVPASSISQTYVIEDLNPQRGLSFYRLRFEGLDGSQHLSRVLSYVFEEKIGTNPLQIQQLGSQLEITHLAFDEAYRVQLWDVKGHLVGEKTRVEQAQTTISIQYLPQAVYIIRLQEQNGKAWSKRIRID